MNILEENNLSHKVRIISLNKIYPKIFGLPDRKKILTFSAWDMSGNPTFLWYSIYAALYSVYFFKDRRKEGLYRILSTTFAAHIITFIIGAEKWKQSQK
jgi:hypothetical protein